MISAIFFLISVAYAHEAGLDCEPKLTPLSLERQFSGVARDLFKAGFVLHDVEYETVIDSTQACDASLIAVQDRVYPRGDWLRDVQIQLRAMMDQIHRMESPRLGCMQVSSLLYEAAVAAVIPSDRVQLRVKLPKLLRDHRLLRSSGKLAEAFTKEIDIAWFDQEGKLQIVEAKNVRNSFFTETRGRTVTDLIYETVEQSRSLGQALRRYDVVVETSLVLRTATPDFVRQVRAQDVRYDRIYTFDPIRDTEWQLVSEGKR